MLDNSQLFYVYNWSTVGTSLVLAALYAYCLIRILRSNKIRFAI
jgi:hypothetical protein